MQLVQYVRPRNTRTEMYAGHVACCSLVSHLDYAPRAIVRLEKIWDKQTDGRQTVTLRIPLYTTSVIKIKSVLCNTTRNLQQYCSAKLFVPSQLSSVLIVATIFEYYVIEGVLIAQ